MLNLSNRNMVSHNMGIRSPNNRLRQHLAGGMKRGSLAVLAFHLQEGWALEGNFVQLLDWRESYILFC